MCKLLFHTRQLSARERNGAIEQSEERIIYKSEATNMLTKKLEMYAIFLFLHFDSSNFYLFHLLSCISTFFCFIVYFSDISANYYYIFLKDLILFESSFCFAIQLSFLFLISTRYSVVCAAIFLPLTFSLLYMFYLSVFPFALCHCTIIDLASLLLRPAMFRSLRGDIISPCLKMSR